MADSIIFFLSKLSDSNTSCQFFFFKQIYLLFICSRTGKLALNQNICGHLKLEAITEF